MGEKMNKKEKEDVSGNIVLLIVGIFFGMMIGALMSTLMIDIDLSQETADDVCVQLTNNSAAVASNTHDGVYTEKLICKIPSYDSTQNIIIESND